MATGLRAIGTGTPGATGGIRRGPLGTGGITDYATEPPAGFVRVGRISEDGLSENYEISTTKVKDWNGKTAKVLKEDSSQTFEFTCLESANAENLRFFYGEDNVTVDDATGAISVNVTGDMLPAQEFVFTLGKDSNGIGRRIFVPYGQPTVSSEVSYVNSDVIKYTVTVDALATESGLMSQIFFSDGTEEVVVTP